MCADKESLNGPITIEWSIDGKARKLAILNMKFFSKTYVLRSGIHSTVRLGQVRAWEYRVS